MEFKRVSSDKVPKSDIGLMVRALGVRPGFGSGMCTSCVQKSVVAVQLTSNVSGVSRSPV